MTAGNGMIATRFSSYKNDDRFLIFASGVSDSKSKNQNDYAREIETIEKYIKENTDKRFVYFSTCSIYDNAEKQSPYVLHKLHAEKIIKEKANNFLIVRASNVAGKSKNPNTVLNYFYYHIKDKINFDAWVNATRNIIDVDDLYLITDYILQHNLFPNRIVNIASEIHWSVEKIIAEIELFLHTSADFFVVEKGTNFDIDISEIKNIIDELNIRFDENYLKKILQKNYSGDGL